VGYLFVGFAVVLAGLIGYREFARRRRLGPVRAGQAEELVRYRTSVRLKLDPTVLPAPKWALGAVGFVLTVREHSFAIVGISPSQSWYLSSTATTIEFDDGWIVVSAIDIDGPVRLWLKPPKAQKLETWNVLLAAGAEAMSAPPDQS